MADQRAQYTEEAVGAGHPTKADVINRLALVEHDNEGNHRRATFPEGAAPATAVGEGAIYTKDSGTEPELFYRRENDGGEIQITKGGVLLAVPAGTKMVFSQAAAPTGWTQTSDNDQVLRVVSGAGGGTGGAASIAGGSVTSGAGGTGSTGSTNFVAITASILEGAGAAFTAWTSGQDGAHTHTGPSHDHSVTYNIKYRDVIIASKD